VTRDPLTGADPRQGLDSFLRPRSIVLLGATERSVWTRSAFANLKALGYDGKVYLVNRRGGQVLGRTAATSAASIGEAVDIALLMVPSDALLDTFPDLEAAGIHNAVLLSSGFAEAGTAGKQRQAQLVETARAHGVRLLGPNCLGFVNFVDRTPVWTVPVRQPILPGRFALVSQSGALAAQMSYFLKWQGFGLTYMVSTGNEADIDVAQVIDFLVTDAATQSIALFIETVRDPITFGRAAARALAAKKPIVVLKVGTSAVAAKAAQAHTDSLVGDDRVFDAACRRLGLARVQSLEDLIVTAELMARTGPLGKGGLGLISISGGMCEIGADRANLEGIEVPNLSAETVERLKLKMADYGTPRNPLDVTGAAMLKPELFEAAVDAVAGDPHFAVLLAVMDVPSDPDEDSSLSRAMVRHVGDGLKRAPLPGIAVSHLMRPLSELSLQIIRDTGINYVPCGVHHAITALGRTFAWSRRLERRASPSPHIVPAGERPQSERETLRYLASRGVPVIPTRIARSAAEAVEFAGTLDGPVVLKIASPDIAHKTEVGGVVLDVIGDEAVAATYEGIRARVKAARPEARIDGVAVSPMRKGGVELFVGTMRDPHWGTVIAVGLGGIWVEALKDTSLRLLPVSPSDVEEMLSELRGSPLLDGLRGAPVVDRAKVAAAVAAIGEAALALGPELVSLEINPLWVSGAGLEALDALAVWANAPHTAVQSAAVQVA
jgi:acetate---CoA ligase (ADP-forming)